MEGTHLAFKTSADTNQSHMGEVTQEAVAQILDINLEEISVIREVVEISEEAINYRVVIAEDGKHRQVRMETHIKE